MQKTKLSRDIDLFIFDWDGTLSSMRLTLRANEAIKRALGIWNQDSSIKDVSHMDYNLKRQLRGEERKLDTMTFLVEVFLRFSTPKLHNNSVKMLERLRSRDKRIAILSNGRSQRLIRDLKHTGVSKYFDSIVSARDIRAIKPNPTGIIAIMREFRAKPARTIYIGDMVDDVITAKLAHVHSCAIADGFDSYHTLKSSGPDYIFKSIEELSKAL